MDLVLLKLNETALLFIKPAEMDPQVVQVTLKTRSGRETVNELAEFHLSQGLITQALLRVIQADMVLCGVAEAELKEREEEEVQIIVGIKSAPDKREPSSVLPADFSIKAERFSIHCHKERWLYPLERWMLFLGKRELKTVVHKWQFRFEASS